MDAVNLKLGNTNYSVKYVQMVSGEEKIRIGHYMEESIKETDGSIRIINAHVSYRINRGADRVKVSVSDQNFMCGKLSRVNYSSSAAEKIEESSWFGAINDIERDGIMVIKSLHARAVDEKTRADLAFILQKAKEIAKWGRLKDAKEDI